MMKQLIMGITGLSLAASLAGCAHEVGEEEATASNNEALLNYGHFFDVNSKSWDRNGNLVTNVTYGDPAQALAKVQEFGLPVRIREPNSTNPTANYGQVCVQMTPNGAESCTTFSNFQCNLQPNGTCAVNIFPLGGVVTKHVIHMNKGTDTLWHASYGGGGPGGSWGYYATYSMN